LGFEVAEGSETDRCFKVTGTNGGDVMKTRNFHVSVDITENNGIFLGGGKIDSDETQTDSYMGLSVIHSIGATQCSANSPGLGEKVCLELFTENTVLVDGVASWTFAHGTTTFDASDKPYTDISGCNGSATTCRITTYLPESFYSSGEPVSTDGIANTLVGWRRFRGLQEGTDTETTVVEIAGFDTLIKIDRPEFSAGMKQGFVAAFTLAGLFSGMALVS
jgi:hypothetical protein